MMPPLDSPNPPPDDEDGLDPFFVFCLTWSMGGALVEADREIFSDYLKEIGSGGVTPQGTLYDVYFEFKNGGTMQAWDKLVPNYVPPKDGKFGSILVPTVDTYKYSWLQK
jgi:hypothetical protein